MLSHLDMAALPPVVSGTTQLTPSPSALTTPFIEIIVGQGTNDNPLKAHQGLLVQSPKLAELIDGLAASDPVSTQYPFTLLDSDSHQSPIHQRRIHLPDEDVDAVGHFVQFLYRGDYAIPESHTPDLSDADKSEENMLRHARIYTLAEKLGLPELKNLAHGKIHKIKGTPGAELAYARYVYTHTKDDDNAIRRPVASHWANQSHILRHEVGDDFQKLCIDVPRFSFDVLSIILDRKEKNSARDDIRGSARKRLRRDV